jgi:periplasmic divalent cation tolerance protein
LRIGRELIEKGLIACANIYESRSLYRWEGKLADEQEQVLICKTVASRAEAAEREIVRLHSYDVPCVIQLAPLDVNRAYLKWVAGEVYGSATTQAAQTE